jgi:hypothetical protein
MNTASDRFKSQIIYTSSVWESAAPYVVWEIATPNRNDWSDMIQVS